MQQLNASLRIGEECFRVDCRRSGGYKNAVARPGLQVFAAAIGRIARRPDLVWTGDALIRIGAQLSAGILHSEKGDSDIEFGGRDSGTGETFDSEIDRPDRPVTVEQSGVMPGIRIPTAAHPVCHDVDSIERTLDGSPVGVRGDRGFDKPGGLGPAIYQHRRN